MNLKLPATHCLVCKDFSEGYCEPISKESLTRFTFNIKA